MKQYLILPAKCNDEYADVDFAIMEIDTKHIEWLKNTLQEAKDTGFDACVVHESYVTFYRIDEDVYGENDIDIDYDWREREDLKVLTLTDQQLGKLKRIDENTSYAEIYFSKYENITFTETGKYSGIEYWSDISLSDLIECTELLTEKSTEHG